MQVATGSSRARGIIGLLLADHEKNCVNFGCQEAPVIELSRYVFEGLRKDGYFILYRVRSKEDGSQVLVLSPLAEYPAPEILKWLKHASFCNREWTRTKSKIHRRDTEVTETL